jgi:ubiquinone/menaquinone biosynthesis C-methylase UbiE
MSRNSTYFGALRLDEAELHRLQIQHQLLTTGMGGLLPEQGDLTRFSRILDVGCGTGDWLLDVASACPQIAELVGIDIDGSMLRYAAKQAESRQLSQRVHFHLLDALGSLHWPEERSFDLVNQRFGASWIRQWEWAPLLFQYRRVSKPGGVIRVSEFDIGVSNSPALEQLAICLARAFAQAGHFFAPERDGLSCQRVSLLQRAGLQGIEQRAALIPYQAGTQIGDLFAQNIKRLFHTMEPFLQKWTPVPSDYKKLCRRALADLSEPWFVATWTITTTWGTTPL